MKHKMSKTKLYKIWGSMKQRCLNMNDKGYKNYGGRGITVCDEWKNDFISFYQWSVNNGYQEGLTIDRINNNGNYEPSNCRWTDNFTQQSNTRKNVYLTIDGETKILSEWQRISKISPYAFYKRYNEGIRGKELLKPTRKSYKGKIIQKDLNGNVVKIWDSLKEIEIFFNVKGTLISDVCRKKGLHKTAYGYKWEHYKEH